MKKINLSKRLTLFLPIFLFVPTVPVAIGSNNILNSSLQNEYLINGTLSLVIIVTVLLLSTKKWSFYDIGFNPKNPIKGFGLTVILCILGLFLVGSYANILGFTETVDISKVDWVKVVKWSFFYVIAQDFMYQSFLSKVGHEIFKGRNSTTIVTILVTILFIWMHSIFSRPLAVMAFVAPGAIIFKLLYNKYQNVYLVFLIHTFYSLLAFYHTVFTY